MEGRREGNGDGILSGVGENAGARSGRTLVLHWVGAGDARHIGSWILAIAFTCGGRRAPISPLAAAHGIVFLAWLCIFLVQSRLVATENVGLHQRLGVAAGFVLASMIPLAYATTTAMVRRGFDRSGNLRIDHDPLYEWIFPLGDLLLFSVLVVGALTFRRRPEIHKRLMLFATSRSWALRSRT